MTAVRIVLAVALALAPVRSPAQPDVASLQAQWLAEVRQSDPPASMIAPAGYLFYVDGRTPAHGRAVLPGDASVSAGLSGYRHRALFEHDAERMLSLGTVTSADGSARRLLVSGWRRIEAGWNKEIDVLLSRSGGASMDESTYGELAQARREWVRLANAHDARRLIEHAYAADAVYFSNGRRSDGREAIIRRYGYMESPGYEVALEASLVQRVSPGSVLEIGRYFAGRPRRAPGGLYVITWARDANGDWKIALDFNF